MQDDREIDKLWNNVVYELLYPAILGSMIYDLIGKFDDYKLLRLSIVAFYIIDYIYLKYIIPKNTNSKVFTRLFDLSIAILFGVSFVLISKGEGFIIYACWIIFIITLMQIFYIVCTDIINHLKKFMLWHTLIILVSALSIIMKNEGVILFVPIFYGIYVYGKINERYYC